MSGSSLTAADVVAVVAAFRPDVSVIENLTRIAPQVGRVVVVDDGSGAEWDPLFERIAEEWPALVRVERLPANRGIASALNVGVQQAFLAGAGAVVTFDQDSVAAPEYVESVVHASNRLMRSGKPFTAVAAGVQSGERVRPVLHGDRGDELTPTLEAIQSGLLITRAAFDQLGPFDEDLFIDCVDTDFVVRGASAGLPTYLSRSSAIDHPLGRTITPGTGGLRISRSGRPSFAFHPPWRRYYISRNRSVMLGRHGLRHPRWAVESLAGEAAQFARSLAFGPEGAMQFAAFALGVLDALLGRRGRLSSRRARLLGAPE